MGWFALLNLTVERVLKTRNTTMRSAMLYSVLLPGFAFIYDTAQSEPYRLASEYRQAAEIVSKHATEGDRVAAVEIGYLGYFSNCNILDIHGLIHKEAQPLIASGDQGWWLSRNPRFVVTHIPPGMPNHTTVHFLRKNLVILTLITPKSQRLEIHPIRFR
jgi:hypothetical protein